MSRAMKCDMCGEYYDPYNDPCGNAIKFVDVDSGGYSVKKHYDLCDRCKRLLRLFIENQNYRQQIIEEIERNRPCITSGSSISQ